MCGYSGTAFSRTRPGQRSSAKKEKAGFENRHERASSIETARPDHSIDAQASATTRRFKALTPVSPSGNGGSGVGRGIRDPTRLSPEAEVVTTVTSDCDH